jgi:hypothetical protein
MKPATTARRLAVAMTLAAFTAPAALAADETMGRLFFSAERRATLDRLRQFNIEEQTVVPQRVITVDGAVTRSSGRSTAWINGLPVTEQGSTALRAIPDERRPAVRVLPLNEAPATVTIGTAVNRSTGERIDPLGGGHVQRRDPPRNP